MRQRIDITTKRDIKLRQKIELTKKNETRTNTIIKRTNTHFYQSPIFEQETTSEEYNNKLAEETSEHNSDNSELEQDDNNKENNQPTSEEENIEKKNQSIINQIQNKNSFINDVKNALKKNKIAKKASTNSIKTKATATIAKNPITLKIILILLAVALVAFGLILLIVLITEYQQLNYVKIIEECTSITVVNTDCDINGNCTNKYSGKVSFEDYVAGVIAAEDSINFNSLEYYKTIAIVTRTELLNIIDSSCEVEGNSSFKEYIPIDESTNKDIIQKAVEETSGKIIIKDEMIMSSPSSTACLVNQDATNYYIRFGSQILDDIKIQKVSKAWASTSQYSNLLENISTEIEQTGDDFSKDCPEGTDDYGITLVGAYYLIDGANYTSDEVIKYYYGNNVEIKKASTIISEGINGFINPVSTINCTSLYGKRTHPVTGKESYHSGIDLGISGGSPVYAVKSGTISMVTKNITITNGNPQQLPGNASYGNFVMINHEDGTSTLYAHMKYGSIPSSIEVGNRVEQGEQIGEVGSTGVSSGNHLHYEVRSHGSTVDPLDYLELTNATGYCAR